MMKLIRLIPLITLLCINGCSTPQSPAPEPSEQNIDLTEKAVIRKSGIPGVLSSTYARVVRIDDETYFQKDMAVTEGGPHRIQVECKICDASLLVFKNCLTFLSEYMPARLQVNTDYVAECSGNRQRDQVEFMLIESKTGKIIARQKREVN